MDLKNLLRDEGAVSPVIGVILMVAITVILAAVIGTFVLGLGSQTASAPQAQFTFEYADPASGGETATLIHDGGDEIEVSTLTVQVASTEAYSAGSSQNSFSTSGWASGGVSAGQSLTITDNGDGGTGPSELEDGEAVRLIWSSPNSDTTNTIAQSEVGF